MRRDTLELADGSLFIERINGRFDAADADLLIRAHAFLSEKACADDSTAHKAAALLIEQDADAITVATALLPPLLWKEYVDSSEIRERFGSTVATTLEDLSSPFIPTTDNRQLPRRDIHAILSSIGGVPRKALLFITFRLIALQKAIGSSGMRARKMAQGKLDLLVPIADRLGLGDLRRRLEDTCFRLLDPAGYERLKVNVAPIHAEDDRYLRILLAGVRRLSERLKCDFIFARALRDGDSIEVLEDEDQTTSGIDTCTNRSNGFDPAGPMHLFKEDYNGKKLLRNTRGNIGGNAR